MLSWPIPKSLRELRGFLELTGYYRKFVEGYEKIAWPLTKLLKKDNWMWTEEAEQAFNKLKTVMAKLPTLALPEFNQQFVIETDASGYGLGAVLTQHQRPIAFYSHALPPRARVKSVYERKLMAIVFAIQKWRPYLLGMRFVVRTDQKSLKFLLDQRLVHDGHQQWLSKLMSYDFEIKYRLGLENKAADALSRVVTPTMAALTIPQALDITELQQQVD